MNQKISVDESKAFGAVKEEKSTRISSLTEGFLEYARYELNFSPETIIKYRDSLKCLVKDIGDKSVEQLEVDDFVKLKRKMVDRGLSPARISSIVFSVRSLLNYCRFHLGLMTLNPKQIRPPKKIKREVIFLTKEEIEALLETTNIKKWNEFRFRVLVEVLLGTGMRIGEALSLNRKDINWETKEAKIVGKGNKERRIFFTDRSLGWIRKYLESRHDSNEAIFITNGNNPRRVQRAGVWRYFDRHRKLARIDKKLTPHILRHTVATSLVFNGCPLVHVKEILGHERLDTTCKYYLGIDRAKAKRAHKKYLNFEK